MDKECKRNQMAQSSIKDNGKMANIMVKEFFILMMESSMKVASCMVISTGNLRYLRTCRHIIRSIRMINLYFDGYLIRQIIKYDHFSNFFEKYLKK